MQRLGVVQRLRGGRQGGGFEHGEHFVEDALLEPAPTQALAVSGAAIQLRRPGAGVAGTVPFRPRIGRLHHPAAAPAAHHALQQRRSLAHGTAAVAAWRTPVGAQLILDLLEPFPGDEPGWWPGMSTCH